MKEIRTIHTCWIIPLVVLLAASVQAEVLAVAYDETCTAGITCEGPASHGCTRTTFTLYATTEVDLCASINCSGDCHFCQTEAYLSDSHGNILACRDNFCADDCSENCGSILLSSGTYTLYCCKIDCGLDNCTRCTSDCTSKARVEAMP